MHQPPRQPRAYRGLAMMGEDLLVSSWRRQLEASLGILEAMLDATGKLYETQLAAVVEAHAAVVATRKAVLEAHSLAELASLQSQIASHNLAGSASYWRAIGGLARDTQARIGESLINS